MPFVKFIYISATGLPQEHRQAYGKADLKKQYGPGPHCDELPMTKEEAIDFIIHSFKQSITPVVVIDGKSLNKPVGYVLGEHANRVKQYLSRK